MKARVVFTATLGLAATLASAEPAPGSPRAIVEAELGRPGIVRTPGDGTVVAKYPRGTVSYRDGRAVKLDLIPAEEWRVRLDREARERAESASRAQADEAALDSLLGSNAYRALSSSGKLARLDAFSREHPAADTAPLRADLAERITRRAQTEARIAALESELRNSRIENERRREESARQETRIQELRADLAEERTQNRSVRTVVQSPAAVVAPVAVNFDSPHRFHPRHTTCVVQNTPQKPASYSQVFVPYNPVSEYTIGAKSPTGLIVNRPNHPVNVVTSSTTTDSSAGGLRVKVEVRK